MAPTRVVNPAAGDVLFTCSGTAYDSQADFTNGAPAAQPVETASAVAGGGSTDSNASVIQPTSGDPSSNRYQRGSRSGVGYTAAVGSYTAATVATASGLCKFTSNAHGLSVGDILDVTDTNYYIAGTHRIVAVTTNTFTTDMPYSASAGTVTYAEYSSTTTVTNGSYVRGASENMTSPCSDLGHRQSPMKRLHAYNYRISTAIRAGYWNPYSGSWSTRPTTADDISDFGSDVSATAGHGTAGKFSYNYGALTITTDLPVHN